MFEGNNENVLCTSEGYSLSGMSITPYPTADTVGKMDYILLVSEDEN